MLADSFLNAVHVEPAILRSRLELLKRRINEHGLSHMQDLQAAQRQRLSDAWSERSNAQMEEYHAVEEDATRFIYMFGFLCLLSFVVWLIELVVGQYLNKC